MAGKRGTDADKDEPTDPITEASEESFPASDPPSFDPGTTGAPPGHGHAESQSEDGTDSRDSEGEWMRTTADAVDTEMTRRREMAQSEHPPAGTQPAPSPGKAGLSWQAMLLILITLVIAVWFLWLVLS